MKTKTAQHNAGECTTSSKVKIITRPDGHRALSPCTEQQLRQELPSRNLLKADKLNGKPGSDRNHTEPKQRNITRDIYLSIDVDFWARRRVDMDFLRRVINCVGSDNVAAAVEHDSVLPHARRYGGACTVLINLDAHSDLGGCNNFMHQDGEQEEVRVELYSWSWVDYVAWPVRQEFCWNYPDIVRREKVRHDASSASVPFSLIRQGLPPGDLDREWRTLRRRLAQAPDYGIDLKRVRAASIVLSPRYCGPDGVEAFKTLVREFKLELLDVLAPDLAAMEPRMAQVDKETPSQTPEDYGLVPLHMSPENVLPVKWNEAPESWLNFRPGWSSSRNGPLRETLRGRCWAEAAPKEGSLISAKGAWYDLQSDAPEDGCQDRAECPTKLWKVIEARHIPQQSHEEDRPPYLIEAVGQVVEEYVVRNKNGFESVARRLIGGV